MYPNCPSVFSIFSTLSSRPANDSDVRNIKSLRKASLQITARLPRSNASSGLNEIPNMASKTEALKLTSTSIVKARYDRIWRPWPTELEASHRHLSGPTSRIPSPLRKSEKQFKQSIIHTPNLQSTTAFSPVPQPTPAPISTWLPSFKSNQLDSKLIKPQLSVLVDPQPTSGFVVLSSPRQNAAVTVTPNVTHLPSPKNSQPERDPFTSTDHLHPSGSRFLSFSLQKDAAPSLFNPHSSVETSQMKFATSAVTPEQDTISFTHASPSDATQKQFAIKAKSPHPPSVCQFSLQEVPSEQHPEQGITPHPQPALPQGPTPLLSPLELGFTLGPFAAEGWESPHQKVGLNLLAAGQGSYQSNFLSNTNTFPPAQSLLFRSPPTKSINFNPFSPEEDAISLPPSPETKCNRLDITHTVQGYKDKFSTDTFNPWLSSAQVPYTPVFPTESSTTPSPLPLALLLSPCPVADLPSNELNIKIAGLDGYLNAENYKPYVTHFLLSRANQVSNSLVVVWRLSHADNGGARGMMSLKALFAQLDERVLDSDRTALSSFSKVSITVPELVKDITPYNDLLQPVEEDDSIDLANVVDLLEFDWQGDFAIFAFKFKNLSFATLTILNIKSSDIGIQDAITLLHSCSDLQAASLGTIRSEEDSDAVASLKSSGVERKALHKLTRLALESDVALHPLIRRIGWRSRISLSLTLRKQGKAKIHQLPLHLQIFSDIELNCHLTSRELINVKRAFPSVTYNDIGI